MSEPERHYADISAERRQVQERREQMREEAKTATAERRTEIGWWMWGASKHLGRLAGISWSRQLGEHRVVIEHPTDEGTFWICTCGAAVPGQAARRPSTADFLAAAGHFEMVPDDTTLSPTLLDRRLAACADDAARLTVLRQWIARVEEAMAGATPSDRQSMALWVWAAQQHTGRITSGLAEPGGNLSGSRDER